MNIIHALVLGAVQGLGEFLPISSSAHLILVPWLLGWQDQGLGYDVALHFGTLLAVLVYFRKDIIQLVRGFAYSLIPSKRSAEDVYQKLSWLVLLATIPSALAGVVLQRAVESSFRQTPLLLAINLAVFGVLLWFVDRVGKQQKNLSRITPLTAFIIGASQAVALVPGVSRSGATMTAARALGVKRQDAARFSFLLSAPIIFGAGLAELPKAPLQSGVLPLVVGFVASAVFGFLAIRYLLRLLNYKDFAVFTWYRLALATIVCVVYFIRG